MAAPANRADFMARLRRAARLPDASEDLSQHWGGSINGQLHNGTRPTRGRIELLSTHLVVCGDEATVSHMTPLASVQSLQRRVEVMFPTRSFTEEPAFRASVIMQTASATLLLVMDGKDAVSFANAVELQWRNTFLLLAPRDAALLQAYALPDAIHALALLPLDIECTLAQQVNKAAVTTIDRPVVVRIEENFSFSIIFRPDEVSDAHNLRALSMDLDEVMLISVESDDIRVCCDDGRVFQFNAVVDAGVATHALMEVFLANAASMVSRNTTQLKKSTMLLPLCYAECRKLYQQYCSVDDNLDGCISQHEFLVSLGPMLTTEKGLPKALYDLFDCFNAGRVRLFEYFNGCRVLLKGDADDRMRYLFHLFDTKRQSTINYQQFLDGLKIISAHATLKIPRNETIETFSFKLFEQIDVNNNNDVDFAEFSLATQHIGLHDLIQAVSAETNADGTSRRTPNPSKVMSFGHPQWVQITQIMRGIELAARSAAELAAAKEGLDTSAFAEKTSFACQSGEAWLGRPGESSPRAGHGARFGPFRRSGGGGGSGVPAGDGVGNGAANGNGGGADFRDYCPQVFHALRTRFGISRESYLRSLGLDQLKGSLLFGALTSLFEMSSSGRSGSFFYSSHDGRYVLKTIPPAESVTLRRILPSLYAHVLSNPDTLITRFCGLHALTHNGEKIHFVVMCNVFQAKLPVMETFDLKGSTVNRSTPLAQRGAGVALKDNDFDNRQLRISHPVRNSLVKQLQVDSVFLGKMNLNDYSLLLGVHNGETPLEPSPASLTPRPQHTTFQQFYGGIPSVTRAQVYFVGIIDILTDYNLRKMGEHLGKSVLYDATQVSCVPPREYQERFARYAETILIGV